MRFFPLVLFAALVAGCNPFRSSDIEAVSVESARSTLYNSSRQVVGQATLQQTRQGVLITVDLSGAPPGTHAFHIHETGRCEPDFSAAGGHFNPGNDQHGLLNPQGAHAGDLPNVHIPDSGRLRFEVLARDVRLVGGANALLDGDATALMLHAFADDYRSDPAGAAGDRIVCGVVGR